MSSTLLAWLFRMAKRRQVLGGVSLVCATILVLFTVVMRAGPQRQEDDGVFVFNKPRSVLSPDPEISFGPNMRFLDPQPSQVRQVRQIPPHRLLRGDKRLRTTDGRGGLFLRGRNVSINSSQTEGHAPKVADSSDCLSWTNRSTKRPPFFLTAIVLLRIYDSDKAKLTTREFKQWLEYVRYAGVEHVYVYDAYVANTESQRGILSRFFQDNFITYVDWHVHNPYTIQGTQVASYQHCIDNYGHEHTWQAAIDIDEYPFSLRDTEPGFLTRFVKQFSEKNPHVSEITMQNYLFLGKPQERELLFERIWRRTKGPANPLVKPIYKPVNVRAQVHHNYLKSGRSMNAPDHELRLNHYWGARLQNWGEDTPDIIAKTQEDLSMEPIVKAFRKCEQYVRQYLE